jgi:hypothetical protein
VLKKSEIAEKHPSGAKAPSHPAGSVRGLKPPPPSVTTFSASPESPLYENGEMRAKRRGGPVALSFACKALGR